MKVTGGHQKWHCSMNYIYMYFLTDRYASRQTETVNIAHTALA